MSLGSRKNLIRAAAAILQEAYGRQRARVRAGFEDLARAGAFRAPDHLQPGLQGELLLNTALQADETRAEAA